MKLLNLDHLLTDDTFDNLNNLKVYIALMQGAMPFDLTVQVGTTTVSLKYAECISSVTTLSKLTKLPSNVVASSLKTLKHRRFVKQNSHLVNVVNPLTNRLHTAVELKSFIISKLYKSSQIAPWHSVIDNLGALLSDRNSLVNLCNSFSLDKLFGHYIIYIDNEVKLMIQSRSNSMKLVSGLRPHVTLFLKKNLLNLGPEAALEGQSPDAMKDSPSLSHCALELHRVKQTTKNGTGINSRVDALHQEQLQFRRDYKQFFLDRFRGRKGYDYSASTNKQLNGCIVALAKLFSYNQKNLERATIHFIYSDLDLAKRNGYFIDDFKNNYRRFLGNTDVDYVAREKAEEYHRRMQAKDRENGY